MNRLVRGQKRGFAKHLHGIILRGRDFKMQSIARSREETQLRNLDE